MSTETVAENIFIGLQSRELNFLKNAQRKKVNPYPSPHSLQTKHHTWKQVISTKESKGEIPVDKAVVHICKA